MKKYLFILILLGTSFQLFSQKRVLKNVEECFYAIPSRMWDFDVRTYTLAEKKLMIDEKDIKNNWLKFTGKEDNEWHGWGEMKIFKKPDKSYLIAIYVAYCGPQCFQYFAFFEWKKHKWLKLDTEKMLPMNKKFVEKRYKEKTEKVDKVYEFYELPLNGNKINIVTQEKMHGQKIQLGSYTLTNQGFTLDE